MKLDSTKRSREAMRADFAEKMQGFYEGEPEMSPFEGGFTAAEKQLAKFDARRYGSRNHVTRGHVSRLSPYIRHGVLTLREARDAIFQKFGRVGESVYKFVFELAWHQFWQEVYRVEGDRIYEDLEEYKFEAGTWSFELPEGVETAATGLVCMDEPLRELYETGYMHNHARMWFAAWLIHHQKVHWSVGERLFFKHLLDGNPPPNALSWQWVASTFGAKPYYFNKQNVEKYTDGEWCRRCTADCPFNSSYEDLSKILF